MVCFNSGVARGGRAAAEARGQHILPYLLVMHCCCCRHLLLLLLQMRRVLLVLQQAST
jgi:hypothetical protein